MTDNIDYYTYSADVWCPACAAVIKTRILNEIAGEMSATFVRNVPSVSRYRIRSALDPFVKRFLEELPETAYDSDHWPKPAQFEPTDSPQHCANGEDCLNAERLYTGGKVGQLLGDELTEDGLCYVNEALAEKNKSTYQRALHQLWLRHFCQYEFGEPA